MGLAAAYKRWRHTRGYGVHSPYAYALLTDVVRLKGEYEYYGYRAIEKSLNRIAHGMSAFAAATLWRDACMLLRLAVYTCAEHAILPPLKESEVLRTALRAANSRMRFGKAKGNPGCRQDVTNSSEPVLLFSQGDATPLEEILDCISQPGSVLYLKQVPEGWRDRIFAAMPEGILLHSPSNLIAIHRPDTAKLAYTIRL